MKSQPQSQSDAEQDLIETETKCSKFDDCSIKLSYTAQQKRQKCPRVLLVQVQQEGVACQTGRIKIRKRNNILFCFLILYSSLYKYSGLQELCFAASVPAHLIITTSICITDALSVTFLCVINNVASLQLEKSG